MIVLHQLERPRNHRVLKKDRPIHDRDFAGQSNKQRMSLQTTYRVNASYQKSQATHEELSMAFPDLADERKVS